MNQPTDTKEAQPREMASESFPVTVRLSSREVAALILASPGESDTAEHWAAYEASRLARAAARGQLRLALKEAGEQRRERRREDPADA